ncbi:MAG: hypothetical protein E7183_06085 [Erysipelotrichaceae bacterium]|nr:hypothetical protein [Erysipelotrichaceae bacterium]
MINNLVFLTENANDIYNPTWYIVMVLLLIILMSPWIFLIFKYGIYRKLRVRFIIEEGKELEPIYLKKGAEIILPEAPVIEGKIFVGWFIDKELTEEYIPIPMPNYNIKLYAKYE